MCTSLGLLIIYVLPLIFFLSVTVYISIMFMTENYKTIKNTKKLLYSTFLIFSIIFSSLLLFLIFGEYPTIKYNIPKKATLASPYFKENNVNKHSLEDPSLPGNYDYSILYYASPDQKTPPYEGQKPILTQTTNASNFLKGWNPLRKSQLGYGADSLPINGQVWMPKGSGTFPLAFIVHGNHEAGERSDTGYSYIGELLASRGIIAVSVDENFLNSSMFYDMPFLESISDENPARAVVLLEHINQWYQWNKDSSSQFYNKVDFENIALIGHSRGGEAVAISSAFAKLDSYPDNGSIKFDYPFQIKTVVAIAPTDKLYSPSNLDLKLEGVNYLLLQGTMDSNPFVGADMYRRVDTSDKGFKSQVWMQNANHGQFNSSWGSKDGTGLTNLIFNGQNLMTMEEQQKSAKVFISAFLEATLHNKNEYFDLFKNFSQGSKWLPPYLYITDYEENNSIILDDFENEFDLGSSSSKMVSYSAEGFDIWSKSNLLGKGINTNRAMKLSWSESNSSKNPPILKANFENANLTVGDTLHISICSGKSIPTENNISFKIKLTDINGNSSQLDINDFGGVVNPIDSSIIKYPFEIILGSSEEVLQQVCIPTSQFNGLKEKIISMEWIFDNKDNKNIKTLYIDDLRVEK